MQFFTIKERNDIPRTIYELKMYYGTRLIPIGGFIKHLGNYRTQVFRVLGDNNITVKVEAPEWILKEFIEKLK